MVFALLVGVIAVLVVVTEAISHRVFTWIAQHDLPIAAVIQDTMPRRKRRET